MNLTRKQLLLWLCVLLGGLTLLVYLPVTTHQFISVDDQQYITGNRHVTSGLSWANVDGHSGATYAFNWHPLTWISHMVDCQLFGLNPGAHHFINVLWHVANTLLVFALLLRLTGAIWASGFVAAFFAWHPLHVESVAWASERKDVLSTFFVLLTLLSYSAYVRRSCIQRLNPPGVPSQASRWYFLTVFCFGLALLSKPMAVTLPFVLLLLDFWPLQRWSLDSLAVFPSIIRAFGRGEVAAARDVRGSQRDHIPGTARRGSNCVSGGLPVTGSRGECRGGLHEVPGEHVLAFRPGDDVSVHSRICPSGL